MEISIGVIESYLKGQTCPKASQLSRGNESESDKLTSKIFIFTGKPGPFGLHDAAIFML